MAASTLRSWSHRRRLATAGCAVVLALAARVALAQDEAASKTASGGLRSRAAAAADDSAGDEAAVRKAAEAYRDAIKRGDVDAVAAFWTDDADYIDRAGNRFAIKDRLAEAREMIAQGRRPANRPPSTEVGTIRFVTPEVAIEDGTFERPGVAGDAPAQGRFTAVWVKENGKWLIDGVREAAPHATEAAHHLKALRWMVGEWSAAGENGTADISCQWGPDGNYLLRKLSIRPRNAQPFTATQWIGWDPKKHHIHSFAFDSRGGYGEGVWEREGSSWAVAATGMLPDGEETEGVNLYTPVDDDTFLWETVDDEIEGEPGRHIHMRMKRKPAAK